MQRTERAFKRLKRRVNCDVRIGDRRHVGVVRDLSPLGFFVQTGATAEIGATVRVVLRQGTDPGLEVEARVANRRDVPARLVSVARGGLGCAISRPPEAYLQLLASLTG